MTAAQLMKSYGDEDIFGDLDSCDCMEEDLTPSEDDYTTTDHIHWYQYGKLVLTIDTDRDGEPMEDYREALKVHMEKERLWPTAWFISDHGNTHPLDLELD